MIRRSHDRWRCPKCRYTALFPPPLFGEPQYWCPMCSLAGNDVAMQKVVEGRPGKWPSRPLRPPP